MLTRIEQLSLELRNERRQRYLSLHNAWNRIARIRTDVCMQYGFRCPLYNQLSEAIKAIIDDMAGL